MVLSDIADMPQSSEVWLLLVRKAIGFLQDEDRKQKRPYFVFLYQIAPSTDLLDHEFCIDPLGVFPSVGLIKEMLEKEIKSDKHRKPPRKPASVIFTNAKLYQQLLQGFGTHHRIPMKLWTEEENACFGDEHVAEFSRKLREKEQIGYATVNLKPGLVKSGVPKDRCVSFYNAAAKFYKDNVWSTFKSKEVFSVTWPGKGTRLFFLAAESADAAGNMFGMETNVYELASLFKDGERKSLQGENDYHRAVIFTNEFAVPLVYHLFYFLLLFVLSLSNFLCL
jgi:hypothetical protein